MKTKFNVFFLCMLATQIGTPCFAQDTSKILDFKKNHQLIDRSDFKNKIFTGQINCDNDTFIKTANFSQSAFVTKLQCDSAIFKDTADFTSSIFFAGASFNKVKFLKNVNFVDAQIGDDLDFTGAAFNKIAFFWNLDFGADKNGSKLIFTKAVLPDTIDFSDNPDLPRNIEFTDACFSQDTINHISRIHFIYLSRTNISKIHIDYDHFRLCFTSPFNHTTLSNDEISACYEGLLKSFKDHGQTMSFKALDIEYHDWQAKTDCWTRVNGWWWKYGYAKERVIWWTLGLFILFSIVNAFLHDLLFMESADELRKKGHRISNKPIIKGLQLLKVSFIYTTVIFSKWDIDFNKLVLTKLLIILVIMLEYLIGLACTGSLLNWVLGK